MAEMPNAAHVNTLYKLSLPMMMPSRSTTERTLREPVRELNCSGIRFLHVLPPLCLTGSSL